MKKDLYLCFDPSPPSPGEFRPFYGIDEDRSRLTEEIGHGGCFSVSGGPGSGKSGLLSFAAEKSKKKRKIIRICSFDSDPHSILGQIPRSLGKVAHQRLLLLDDMDKGEPDKMQVLLFRLRPLFETKGLSSFVSIPENLGEQALRGIVGEAAPLLGIFSHMIRLPPMAETELLAIMEDRLHEAHFDGGREAFSEAEALRLALTASRGSPQRWLHILKEGCFKAGQAGKSRLGFNEIFDVIASAGTLDLTFKRILFMLSKKEVITGQEKDVLEFTALDRKSLHRRLDLLVEKRIAEIRAAGPDQPSQEYRLRATTLPEPVVKPEKVNPEEIGFETMHS